MYLKIGKGLPKWSNYELAIGRAKKEDPIRIATFLTVIGDEALDVFNAFMCGSDEDSSRAFWALLSTDKYATVIRNTAASCEF